MPRTARSTSRAATRAEWDAGNQITIRVQAMGLEETAVQELVSPPSGAPLLSALGDIAGFRHDDLSVAPATTFKNPAWSTTSSIDFAELGPGYVARVGDGDTANGVKCLAISSDGGTSWSPPSKQPSGVTSGGTVAVAASGGGALVWSTVGAGVQTTSNGGKTWKASTGIPAGAAVSSDRVNASKFYGYAGGVSYVSTNGGTSFSVAASSGLPNPGQLKPVPGREGHLWLAGGATGSAYGLWRSTNSGASFSKLANVEEADTVGFGKAAAGQPYVALYVSAKIDGVRGIFRSTDEGASWVRINDDLQQWGWTGKTISGDPRVFGRVYLGTNGRGILYGDPVP